MKKMVLLIILFSLVIFTIYIQSDKAPTTENVSLGIKTWKLKQKIFEYDGFKLAYRDSLDSSKSDNKIVQKGIIVLLHGYPTSSYDWHLIWDELSVNYRLVAMDMLGYGFSDKPSDIEYSISLQTDIQQALLSKLGIKEAYLLTHDYGNNVAQELLARMGQKSSLHVKSLVLLNGGMFPEVYKQSTIQALLRSPIGPLVSKLANETIFSKSFNKVFGLKTKLTSSQITDHWYLVCYNEGNKINHLLTHAADDRKRNRERWLDSLLSKNIPILFINGLDDPISGKETVERYETLIPKPNTIKLDGVGHYPHLEVPDIVIKEFEQFVE